MTNNLYTNKWKVYTVDKFQARILVGTIEGESKMARLVRRLQKLPDILYVDAMRVKKV